MQGSQEREDTVNHTLQATPSANSKQHQCRLTHTHTSLKLTDCVQIVTMQGSQEREDTVNHTPSNTNAD